MNKKAYRQKVQLLDDPETEKVIDKFLRHLKNEDDYIEFLRYMNILLDHKQQLYGSGFLKDTLLKVFQKVANAYRRNYCSSKARPLELGEIHFQCSNFSGPGTKYSKYSNVEPYDCPDAVAKVHDREYNQIHSSKMSAEERQKAIRESDDKLLRDVEKCPNSASKYATKYGISAKNKLEDIVPVFMKAINPNYFGKK